MSSYLLIQVILIALTSTATVEFITWWFVYSKPDYTKYSAELAQVAVQLKTPPPTAALTSGKERKRKQDLARLKDQRQKLHAKLANFNMRTAGVNLVTLLLTYNFILSRWNGLEIATLPFEPFGFMLTLTQRGLENPSNASITAAYFPFAMSLMIWRAVAQHVMTWNGWRPVVADTGSSLWEMASEEADKHK